ncbi:putative ATPase/DNA-binding SARP family transcriptional activator [Catenulispora sp. EB89]|uniref:BTAD domain-containing putative transcriptional regulator n=1 Tax=Catenulispora sp. EB89 TaxID=3156257 RepID=UPI003513E62B
MRVALLGPVGLVSEDGVPVGVGGPRVRALLALCALQPGRPVVSARLIDAIWGEQPPENAANALQTLVKRLRAVCGRAAVVRRAGGYALMIEPCDVDAHRFTHLLMLARRQASANATENTSENNTANASELAASTLVQALREWTGPALADLTGFPQLASAAAALETARLEAVELLADCRLALGRAEESIPDLAAEVAAHPLREPLTARLMTALAAAGRRSEALTSYQAIRRLLADELGVYPSPELAAVHTDLLRQDAAHVDAHAPASEPRGPRTNLPRPLTSFVGRDAEVGTISRLLEDSALVTLTGPGGTGKTRLALETAARLSGGHPDGVWLVELGAVAGPARLGGAVLGALAPLGARGAHGALSTRGAVGARGVPAVARPGADGADSTEGDSAAAVAEALADRRALLVIDNCEHLIDAVAALVHTILERCPGIRILATSREPLDVPGERLLPVPPLALAPADADADPRQALQSAAVRLFADRAAQSRPGFGLDTGNSAAVCAICRHLDGIPLALELAAIRTRSMDPADVAAGLADRFRLLAAGPRTAAPRHRSLRAVVAWSWDLLTEAERDLARRLAVFVGGTTADTVRILFGEESPGLLASLADKSIVQWDGARYSMLETIRAYAAEDAQAHGVLAAASRSHAEFFTCLVERGEPALRTAEQVRWLAILAAEHDNCGAALGWAVENGDVRTALRLFGSLSWYLLLRGHRTELTAWRRRVLPLVPFGPDALDVPGGPVGPDVPGGSVGQGGPVGSVGQGGPPPGLASAYLSCAFAADLQDHLDPARWNQMVQASPGFLGVYARALSEERGPHPVFRLVTAVYAGGSEDFAELTASADPWLVGNALLLRGSALFNAGDYASASADLAAAVEVLRGIRDQQALLRALLTLATVVVRTDGTAAASELLAEADALLDRWPGTEEAVNALAWIAHLYYWDGNLDAAEVRLKRARAHRLSEVSEAVLATLAAVEADVRRGRGDLRGALADYAAVIRQVDGGLPPDDPVGVYPAITLRLAAVSGLTSGPAAAVAVASEASRTSAAQHPQRHVANAGALWVRLSYAFALIEDGQPAAAAAQLATLLDLLRTSWHLPLLLGSAVAFAALAHDAGDPTEAAVLLGAAASLHRERATGGPNTVRVTERVRTTLGTEEFARAVSLGARMAVGELVERLLARAAGGLGPDGD